ncbi:hypothetical protein SAMN06269117_10143 [Balnearium lithotrophicum]|uniref:Nucleotidyltransferase domain-containing protein n=1 Tax=Balnearium lithotrophicum TaxID=223788 RepID=A0A521ABL0_9BACT|nr:hypothetical protein SAMN06269117_10143 [Balnearium lithotrophicum]
MCNEIVQQLNYKYPEIQDLIKYKVKILWKNIKIPFKFSIFGSFATRKATYFSDFRYSS